MLAAATTQLPSPPKLSSFQLGTPVAGKKVARVMKDGKRLCVEFQQGRCNKGAKCPDRHMCGIVLRGERVCGSTKHGAKDCKQKVKA